MDAAVIVCAYTFDRWEILGQAVASVRAQTLPARELILVVDGNDELLRRARAELDVTTAVANRHSGGLSGGRVTGADEASAPILAFLDDDAIADGDWLAELVRPFEDPHVLGTGGWVEPLWEADAPPWLPAELNWIVGCTYAGLSAPDGRIRNPIGANMAMRADVLARTGGFAPALGRSDRGKQVSGTADETEFCIRAARLHPGGYWAFAPGARVRHLVPASRTTWDYFVTRCRLEGTAKAVLMALTGTDAGLASERAYARSVLPRAVVRELAAAARGDRDGLRRAGAILAGLAITGAAYGRERARLGLQERRGRP